MPCHEKALLSFIRPNTTSLVFVSDNINDFELKSKQTFLVPYICESLLSTCQYSNKYLQCYTICDKSPVHVKDLQVLVAYVAHEWMFEMQGIQASNGRVQCAKIDIIAGHVYVANITLISEGGGKGSQL